MRLRRACADATVLTCPPVLPCSIHLQGQASGSTLLNMGSVVKVLDEMAQRGIAPSTVTFNTLMAAAVEAGEGALALTLYERLEGAGLAPDGLTYTVCIQAHALVGDLSGAQAAFEALSRDKNASLDLRAYNTMVAALAQNLEMKSAEKMLGYACDFAKRQGQGLWQRCAARATPTNALSTARHLTRCAHSSVLQH